MSDLDIGKREIEREHLELFLDAYKHATGESFPEIDDCETPDFIARDETCRVVGIELAQLRFGPEKRVIRQIDPPAPHDPDAWEHLLELIHKKDLKLTKGNWSKCERKILVILLIDTSLESIALASDTASPEAAGFDEIWLADYTQVEPFGAVDLFAVVHAEFEGHFATGDQGQKPYG